MAWQEKRFLLRFNGAKARLKQKLFPCHAVSGSHNHISFLPDQALLIGVVVETVKHMV